MTKLNLIDNDCYSPLFYNLGQKGDELSFNTLIKNNQYIQVFDEIDSQLRELIKLRHPKLKLSEEELDEKIRQHIGDINKDKYGIWVFYPWLNKIVHLLGKDEFIEVRTNRNQYKITPDEEEILASKKIGIIGLSVGKAIATTIAMERICGELVLADFDLIELSNLNRIQTGVYNFNVKKTVVAAREIAEFDPFLKVSCLHDGLTEKNANVFFTQGGKLDICIEVCDGLTTKIFARQKAKELRIPVVMNSSDRGTTDVERYDLNPEMPILHGLIDHLDLTLVKEAKTNEEKIPYLLPMLGLETSSERLKASMLEIEQTITTWPQLASGVIFGGGICTDVCRRILLGQFTKSGRYFVDSEKEINDNVKDYISYSKLKSERVNIIPNSELKDYENAIKQAKDNVLKSSDNDNCELTSTEIESLISYAIMAPSGGNIQPWKWLHKDKNLLLFNDINRSVSILNYKNTASLISFGAATENLIIKSHSMGYEVEVVKFPLGEENNLIASFRFYKSPTPTTEEHNVDHFLDYIPKRLTNRNLSSRVSLDKADENYFKEIVKHIPGARLKIFTNVNRIDKLKTILSEVDKLFMTNKTGHTHFIHEIRWNKQEVEETRDGIDINTIDLTPTEKAGLIVSKNWNVTKHIKKWKFGNAFGKLSQKAVDSASALGVIVMPKFNNDGYFEGGRAVQKLWLAATEKDIAFQPMSISTFLFAKVGDNNFEDIEDVKEELISLYQELRVVCEISDSEKDVFFFRLAKAPNPKVLALRRAVNDVLMN